jgi:hypothetical protein
MVASSPEVSFWAAPVSEIMDGSLHWHIVHTNFRVCHSTGINAEL